jgi:hypothetical protein
MSSFFSSASSLSSGSAYSSCDSSVCSSPSTSISLRKKAVYAPDSPSSITGSLSTAPSPKKFQPQLTKNQPPKIPTFFLSCSTTSTSSDCTTEDGVDDDCSFFSLRCPPKRNISRTNSVRKKISFHSTVSVVLIPSREEYDEIGLTSSLWYNREEIRKMEKKGLVCLSFGRLYEEN